MISEQISVITVLANYPDYSNISRICLLQTVRAISFSKIDDATSRDSIGSLLFLKKVS
jgi:hypothetical protein